MITPDTGQETNLLMTPPQLVHIITLLTWVLLSQASWAAGPLRPQQVSHDGVMTVMSCMSCVKDSYDMHHLLVG